MVMEKKTGTVIFFKRKGDTLSERGGKVRRHQGLDTTGAGRRLRSSGGRDGKKKKHFSNRRKKRGTALPP